MELNPRLVQGVPLLKGIESRDFGALLGCVGARKERYDKGAFILLGGQQTRNIGIILSGRAQVLKEDIFGNRAILNDLGPRGTFGESFVCGGSYTLTVSVQASESCEVLFLPFDRVMHMCPSACGFHNTLIRNMVETIAIKNIKLMETLEITTKHSLREKVLTYLSHLAQEQGTAKVTSPLGRVDLADFLGVDRSALTRELKRMQDEGLIRFEKNTYTLTNVHL